MLLERPKPIATQVNDLLRQRILTREYAPGVRLPSESDLAHELGVSRATLRTALARLASEGLIIRRQGDGTFVNEHIQQVNTKLGGVLDFWRLIEASGRQPSIQTISISPRLPYTTEAEALGISTEQEVLSLIRLFFADGYPFILAMNVIPQTLFTTGADPLYDGRLPLRKFMRRYCHKEIAYAIYDIGSVLTNERVLEFLNLPPDSPLLLLTITFYDVGNNPLVYGKSYYDDTVLGLSFVQTWR